MSHYNISSARTPEQVKRMQHLLDEGICAFCPEHFSSFHDNPIEFRTSHWVVTKNDYPYEHTSLHLLLIPLEHVSFLHELSKEARDDYINVLVRVEQTFKLPSYGTAMRVGDMRYNGGSVLHLHSHVIVGDFSDPKNHQKVRFKLSSVPESNYSI